VQGSAFLILQNNNLIFDLFIQKIQKKLQWRHGKNLKIL